jgi:hypothetical protein
MVAACVVSELAATGRARMCTCEAARAVLAGSGGSAGLCVVYLVLGCVSGMVEVW